MNVIILIIIYGFIMLCKQRNSVCTLMTNILYTQLHIIFMFYFLCCIVILEKNQNNQLMSV